MIYNSGKRLDAQKHIREKLSQRLAKKDRKRPGLVCHFSKVEKADLTDESCKSCQPQFEGYVCSRFGKCRFCQKDEDKELVSDF